MAELHELTALECESLLRSHNVGRVAVSTPTGPHIIPLNYSVIEGENVIIVRTSPYSVLGTYGRDTTLALQIDGFDHERELGWSVQARGRASVVEDYAEIAHIHQGRHTPPWAGGSRSQYMRLPWNELTGRRLGSGWSPVARPEPQGKVRDSV
jgi:nitroimidazol reductase NimA-like FMN-containing flavoprotein (pyridoxamine 5'-phosphate oxidase superfamily)